MHLETKLFYKKPALESYLDINEDNFLNKELTKTIETLTFYLMIILTVFRCC